MSEKQCCAAKVHCSAVYAEWSVRVSESKYQGMKVGDKAMVVPPLHSTLLISTEQYSSPQHTATTAATSTTFCCFSATTTAAEHCGIYCIMNYRIVYKIAIYCIMNYSILHHKLYHNLQYIVSCGIHCIMKYIILYHEFQYIVS